MTETATILNNARIGEGSIIAAGALIPEGMVIPPNSLVAGLAGGFGSARAQFPGTLAKPYFQEQLEGQSQEAQDRSAPACETRRL